MYALAELLQTWMSSRLGAGERGSAIVEYCLLLAVVGAVTLGSASFVSDAVQGAFSSVKLP